MNDLYCKLAHYFYGKANASSKPLNNPMDTRTLDKRNAKRKTKRKDGDTVEELREHNDSTTNGNTESQ